MGAVRGEHSAESSDVLPGSNKTQCSCEQVDARFGLQRDELRNEVHRLEDDVRDAIAVQRLELLTPFTDAACYT